MADCILNDMGAMVHSYNELRQSEQQFRFFVENADDVFFVLTSTTEFSYVSPQWKECFGYELSDVIGKYFATFVHPDDLPVCNTLITTILETGKKQQEIEFRVLHKNGSWLWYRANGSRIVNQDGTVSLIGIGHDITDYRLTQNELLKAQKLESLSVLAAGIAHNFNNVLTGVIGYISFARKQLKANDMIMPFLEGAENSSYKAAALARQLLVFSKEGARQKELVSAEELVQESITLFLMSLMGSGIKGVVNNRAALSINVDSAQISQAFNNIVLNSMYSMPQGGLLTVNVEDLLLNKNNEYLLNPGSYLKIEFEDSGCGIEKNHLDKVFDPYFTTRTDGTGLGLSTTYGVIVNHGGHISIVSEVNHGTTVKIILPGFQDKPADGQGETENIVQNPVSKSSMV